MKTISVFETWMPRLKEEPLSIEHFRIPSEHGHGFDHVAVLVRKDGACFVGRAILSKKDVYNRKLGYMISVGRACKRATWLYGSTISRTSDFSVDPELKGFELRDVVAKSVIPHPLKGFFRNIGEIQEKNELPPKGYKWGEGGAGHVVEKLQGIDAGLIVERDGIVTVIVR